VAEQQRYLLMDLFAGCGGMTRGFVDSGRFEPIFAAEADEDAAATYAANFGDDHVASKAIEEIPQFPNAVAARRARSQRGCSAASHLGE
jgi:site-specific DNA-cytosine methylase